MRLVWLKAKRGETALVLLVLSVFMRVLNAALHSFKANGVCSEQFINSGIVISLFQ